MGSLLLCVEGRGCGGDGALVGENGGGIVRLCVRDVLHVYGMVNSPLWLRDLW